VGPVRLVPRPRAAEKGSAPRTWVPYRFVKTTQATGGVGRVWRLLFSAVGAWALAMTAASFAAWRKRRKEIAILPAWGAVMHV